ncbi:tetratricopeptide repeat domain protein [Verrucomicrobiia bacterium DG1235]|nr:tetratricopeptide repeat domain protein [Verrucomicrobiae bacterium DG1235]
MSDRTYFMVSHLWESTLFGIVCVLLILALGRSWSYSRHFLAWASLLKLLVPFSALAPVFSFFGKYFASGVEGEGQGLGYLDLTARGLKIDTWVDLGGVEVADETGLPWELLIGGVWGAGVMVLATLWLRQYLIVTKTLGSASELADDGWQELAGRVWKNGIQKMPRILVCREEGLLAGVFGIVRPSVVIPASLDRALSEAEREAFLRHEFQHVYKRDTLWLFVQTLIRNLFWMHPLVWWLDRQISAEREILRDEEVIRKTENVTSYLNCLMKVSKIKLPSSYATSVGIMGAPFVKRIKSISRYGKSRVGDVVSAIGSVLAVVALMVFLSASLSLSDLRAEAAETVEKEHKLKVEPDLTEAEQALVKEVLGFIEEQGGKERALKKIQEAIDEDSTAAFEFIAGNFHAEKGELEKAIEYYQLAAGKFPSFLRAIRNCAILQVKEGHYEDAKVNFLRATQLGADDTTTYGLLGLSYINTGDPASAEHYYRLALEKDSTVKDWKVGLAKALLQSEQYSKAEEVLVPLVEEAKMEGNLKSHEILLGSLKNARLAMGQ